jgi:hypothetical protein
MVSAVLIQSKVAYGYAIAAARVGDPYQQYRPTGTGPALAGANLIGTLPAQFAADKAAKFASGSDYGNARWYGIFDMSKTQPGDYLVGLLGTFFVADVERFAKPLCLLCSHVVTVSRMPGTVTPGAGSYAGDTTPETVILTSWPASVLVQSTKTSPGTMQLPDESKMGTYQILLPASAPGPLLRDDILTDEIGNRYAASTAEQSNLGWRLNVEQWAV